MDSQIEVRVPEAVGAGRGRPSASAMRPAQSLTSAISNAVVRIYAEHIGRGPTKARTVVSRNLVTVILEDTFTKGERFLLEGGERAAVLTARRAYQRALRDQLKAAVEQLTGRTVIGVLSDHHDTPDIAVENFILEPEPYDDLRADGRHDGRRNDRHDRVAISDEDGSRAARRREASG